MYWADGFDSAPEVVGLAVDSWKSFNPDLEIVLLDDENLGDFVSEARRYLGNNKIGTAHRSDLIRLALLVENGGFWADSTLLCTRPLSEWISFRPLMGVVLLKTGPQKNRFVQNFFIGSAPGAWFCKKWLRALEKVHFSDSKPMTKGSQKRWRKRRPYLWANPLVTSFWAWRAIHRRTGYPYLIAHYIANRLILFRLFGALTYWIGAFGPIGEALHLQNEPNGTRRFANSLNCGEFPLWKLTWRFEVAPTFWNAVLVEAKHFLRKRIR